MIAEHVPLVDHAPLLHVADGVPAKPLEQVYEHDDPEFVEPEPHPEGEAFPIVGGGLLHCAVPVTHDPDALQTPLVHNALGDPVKPDWQEYVHDSPEFVVLQEGAFAFAIVGALVPTHRAKQTPLVVHVLLEHVAETVPVNPVLQTYEQVDPDAVVPDAHAEGFALEIVGGGFAQAVVTQAVPPIVQVPG